MKAHISRNFNYTGRQRIERERFNFTIKQKTSDALPELLIDSLDLQGLGLEDDWCVHLDARSRHYFHRVRLGTVSSIENHHPDLPLGMLGPGIKYRLIVVKNTQEEEIAASAENVHVARPGEHELEGAKKSLLPLVTKELGGRAWSVLLEDGKPSLAINKHLPDPAGITKHPFWAPLVIPEALRRIVLAFYSGTWDDWEESNRKLWIEFAERLAPPTADVEDNVVELEEWADLVVHSFCNKHGFVSALKEHLEAAQ